MAVGTIVKAFGVRGEVIVQPMTDFPERFRKARVFWLGANTLSASKTGVESAVVSPRGIRLKLKGIDDRDRAEGLRGKLLFIDEAASTPLREGQYFVHDMLGLAVQEESGRPLGEIADVLRYPANDVYVVRGGRGEILIPAVKEFIRSVDIASRTMTVRLIEGMAEEHED